LELSSFTHYKRNIYIYIYIDPSAKKMATVSWDYEGLLLCEFRPPKTATTVTNTVKLLKNCPKPLRGAFKF
jgi:hypothetical protein